MSITSEELIRQVRAAKSPAQENAIIETELSAVRSSFKLKDQPYIARNVAKVVYASMRGHNVSWADMGIVNLCQSAKNHEEKRLSYLALQLLPHDNQMYLKMASNNFKQDMESGSQYRASVAIVSLAAVGSGEMLAELSASTLSLINNEDSIYLRKKALILALITTKKAPEVAEGFVTPCIGALQSKTHSVCLAACQLAIELISSVPSAADSFGLKFSYFVKLLQQLAAPTYNSEDHEISGVADPFLQASLLRLLAVLCARFAPQEQEKRSLCDVLETVVSTPARRSESITARVSIQFEAARTIMSLSNAFFGQNEALKNDLRASAADALTASLSNKNQTVKYSALSAISEIIHRTGETQGAQRHLQTVLSCMQEESITLRRRALNLLVLICSKETAESVVDFLTGLIGQKQDGRIFVLQDALNEDIRQELISSIAWITELFSTDVKWEFDVLLQCLELCGPSQINQDLVRQATSLVAREKGISEYACQKFAQLLEITLTEQQLLYNETLICSALYCVGELAHFLKQHENVVNALANICQGSIKSNQLVKYSISTIAKMITKCPAASEILKQLLCELTSTFDPEIQQRAFEYSMAILDPKAAGLLGAIPPPPKNQSQIQVTEGSKKQVQVVQQIANQVVSSQPAQQVTQYAAQQIPQQQMINQPAQQIAPPQRAGFAAIVPGQAPPTQAKFQPPAPRQLPFAMPSPQKQGSIPQIQAPQQQVQKQATDDLLGLNAAPVQKSSNNVLDDLFDAPVSAQQQQQQQPQQPQSVIKQVYQNEIFTVQYRASPIQKGADVQFIYSGIGPVAQIKAFYAAPNNTTCKVQPASSQQIGSGQPPVTQVLQVTGANLALKIKVQYVVSGATKEQVITVSSLL